MIGLAADALVRCPHGVELTDPCHLLGLRA